MSQATQFDQLFRKFTEALPQGAFSLPKDVEKNLQAALNATFNRMNLVTREEFDVQAAVLARTRARLEALEKRVAALEGGSSPAESPETPPRGDSDAE